MPTRRLVDLELPPDVFAVVMATGILSVAGRDHDYPLISDVLVWLATAAFAGLAAGLALRILARPAVIRSRAHDPDVALRMFTFVAAASVLAARWTTPHWANALFGALAALGWLVLVPFAAVDARSRPRAELRDHAHGAWLLPSVATFGLVITAANLGARAGTLSLVVLAAALWLVGIVLYGAVTWLIAWRSVAAPFVPAEVTPDSWILMGGLAIATLAGNRLLAATRALGAPSWLGDAARPVTLVCWIAASLWIPVLLYAEVWRLDRQPGSLHYEGVWWSAVFPLGMYATATAATAGDLRMPQLTTISLVFFWVAFTVWTLVAVGLIHAGVARRRQRP